MFPTLCQQHGPLTAEQLTTTHEVLAQPAFLERALRACASVGLFTEDAAGRFGPTPLSEVLTADSPVSVKKLTEVFGGTWWKVWTGLPEALASGQPQAKAQLGMEFWDYCNANPKEMEDFAEAMKSNSLNSMNGVLQHCDFSDIADGGGRGRRFRSYGPGAPRALSEADWRPARCAPPDADGAQACGERVW